MIYESYFFVSADVKVNHLPKSYVISMGTYQMACMLAFNTSDTVTSGELMTLTGLEEAEVLRQVQSIVDSKLIKCEVSFLSPPLPDL